MIQAHSKNLMKRIWLCCFVGLALASSAQERITSDELGRYFGTDLLYDDWTRHFRVGAMVALNVKADFSMSGSFPISTHPTGVYDDGYVLTDQTGNAQGFTSYWGYNSASQYDASAQTLTMHSANSFSGTSRTSADDSPYLGFDMAYGGKLWRSKRLTIGWDFGFGLLPLKIKDNRPFNADLTVQSYVYPVPFSVMPTAPYHGGPSGEGQPTLGVQWTPGPTQTIPNQTVTGSRSLDMNLYTLRLGPSFHYELSRYLAASASVGGAFGIISGDYHYDETLGYENGATARNTGNFGATKTVCGGYATAALMYHAVENGDIYIAAQYMPMGDTVFSSGGRQARLKLGGAIYFSAGFNWPF